MKKLIFLFSIVLALTFSYCDNFLGSCTVSADVAGTTLEYCFQYSGDTGSATQDDFDTACTAASGTYSEDECAVKNAVGTCEYDLGGVTTEAQYGAGYDATSAKAACDLLGGTWK